MIPALDGKGLLPPGKHLCTLAEARESFCFNEHRAKLFDGLEQFLAEHIYPLGLGCPIYLDGSFVRAKANPEDIDLVIDASGVDDAKLCKLLLLRYSSLHLKQKFRVDFWLKHPEIPNDLVDFFQYVGAKAAAELRVTAKHPKGILRINP